MQSIEVTEEGGTEVQGRISTTQATSLAQPEEASLGSGAKVETLGTNRDGATAAEQLDGGALMITWIVIAVSWSVGADGGIPLDMRVLMLPFKS